MASPLMNLFVEGLKPAVSTQPTADLDWLARQGRNIPWANKTRPQAEFDKLVAEQSVGGHDPVTNLFAQAAGLYLSLTPAGAFANAVRPAMENPSWQGIKQSLEIIGDPAQHATGPLAKPGRVLTPTHIYEKLEDSKNLFTNQVKGMLRGSVKDLDPTLLDDAVNASNQKLLEHAFSNPDWLAKINAHPDPDYALSIQARRFGENYLTHERGVKLSSLDAPVEGADDLTRLDTIASSAPNPEEQLITQGGKLSEANLSEAPAVALEKALAQQLQHLSTGARQRVLETLFSGRVLDKNKLTAFAKSERIPLSQALRLRDSAQEELKKFRELHRAGKTEEFISDKDRLLADMTERVDDKTVFYPGLTPTERKAIFAVDLDGKSFRQLQNETPHDQHYWARQYKIAKEKMRTVDESKNAVETKDVRQLALKQHGTEAVGAAISSLPPRLQTLASKFFLEGLTEGQLLRKGYKPSDIARIKNGVVKNLATPSE